MSGRLAARRARAERRRGWFPRWTFPALATPGSIWMLVFFGAPLFAVIAVATGRVDPVFESPIPVWNPLHWNASAFAFSIRELVSPQGVFHTPAIRTFVYVAIAVAVCLVIGFPVAYCVARHARRTKGLLLSLLLAPFFISYLMRMLAWVNLLQPDGMVNRALVALHLTTTPPNWLDGRPTTVIFGLVYGYIPYVILPLFGSLDLIDASLLEAARDLGASPARVFFRVTLPLSKPAIVASCLIVGLPMLGDYYTNDLLSGSPRTTMIANQIDFLIHAQNSGPTIGAAVVILLLAVMIIPLVWYFALVREQATDTDEVAA